MNLFGRLLCYGELEIVEQINTIFELNNTQSNVIHCYCGHLITLLKPLHRYQIEKSKISSNNSILGSWDYNFINQLLLLIENIGPRTTLCTKVFYTTIQIFIYAFQLRKSYSHLIFYYPTYANT